MLVPSKLGRWSVPLVAWVLAGCPQDGTTPTQPPPPPTSPPVARVEREWQYFVLRNNATAAELLGERHHQEAGVVVDKAEFGQLFVEPNGAVPVGLAQVFSDETAQTYWAEAQAPHATAENGRLEGAGVGLYQVYHYVIDADDRSLKFTLSALDLETMDFDPGPPTSAQCLRNPDADVARDCSPPILADAEFGIWAHRQGQPDILSKEGHATIRGYLGHWQSETRTEDADAAAFRIEDFTLDPDLDESGVEAHARFFLTSSKVFTVPLTGLAPGDTLIVETRIAAWAEDRRQLETFSGAYARDPVTPIGVTIESHGVHLVPFLSSVAIPVHVQQPAPACSGGPNGSAGTLQFSAAHYETAERGVFGGQVSVSRTGGTTGLVSATVTTRNGTATGGSDYSPVTTVVRWGDGEGGSRNVGVPLVGDDVKEPDETVNLTLSVPGGCASLGGQNTAVLTIRDDDDQPSPTEFSIGGSVTGLTGTGLVLHERTSGFESRPTSDGPFTIVPARGTGFQYDVIVATQPSNPLQTCTVANGAGTLATASVTNITVTCTAPTSTGALDPTFGTGGRVTSTILGGATTLALQPDGKIVIAGDSKVQRFNSNGTPDQGFGSGGQADFLFPNELSNLPQAVAIQPDGRIVVVGYVRTNSRDDFAVARYLGDGTLDQSFGAGGRVIVDFTSASARGWAITLQDDGKIVVAGQAAFPKGVSFDNDFAVARLTTSGVLDPSFGVGGRSTTDLGGQAEWANAVGIQSSGKIVLAGRSAADGGSDPEVAVVRYQSDGSVDGTFSSHGAIVTDLGLGAAWKEAFDLVILSDGRFVIAGQAQIGANFNYLVARFTIDGALDPTFGAGGVTATPFTTQGDVGRGVALDASGGIVVAGRTALFGTADFGVARYASNGQLDASFGNGGKVVLDFLSGSDGAEAVKVQPNGKIVVAGFARNGTNTGAGIVRIIP